MKKQIQGIVIGILIMLFLTNVASARGIEKTIEVVFNQVNLEVNDKKVNEDDILYNGTTYVPLRFVSENLGYKVEWSQETKTVLVYCNRKLSEEGDNTLLSAKGDNYSNSEDYSILNDERTTIKSDLICSIDEKYGIDLDGENAHKFFLKCQTGRARHESSVAKNQVLKIDYYMLNDGGNLRLEIYDDNYNLMKTLDSNSKGTIEIQFHELTKAHIDIVGENTHCYVDVKWSVE